MCRICSEPDVVRRVGLGNVGVYLERKELEGLKEKYSKWPSVHEVSREATKKMLPIEILSHKVKQGNWPSVDKLTANLPSVEIPGYRVNFCIYLTLQSSLQEAYI